jgi:hypothetical protein
MIAKIHNDPEKENIWCLSRQQFPLSFNRARVSIYPDYTAEVTSARTFMELGRNSEMRESDTASSFLLG